VVVVEGVLEAGEEAGVFGEIIGAHAEEFAEFGEDIAMVVVDDGSVTGGTGVAAGSTVAVGVDPVMGLGIRMGSFLAGLDGVGGRHGRGFGEEAGSRGVASHRKSLRDS
jgi:hypothetical protein